jgi:hypothetical protein
MRQIEEYRRRGSDCGVSSCDREKSGFGYELIGGEALSGLVVASLEQGGEEVVATFLGEAPLEGGCAETGKSGDASD